MPRLHFIPRWLIAAALLPVVAFAGAAAWLAFTPRGRAIWFHLEQGGVTERFFHRSSDFVSARARLQSPLASTVRHPGAPAVTLAADSGASPPPALPLAAARIVVHKAARTLDLFDGTRLIRSYHIGLGQRPVGAKERANDGRTPEGRYFICTRIPSQFHWFLGLSYPSAADAARGRASGLIDDSQAAAIKRAELGKIAPPWDGPLGGAIGIHGGGDSDWTGGCIAVTNAAIEEIFVATSYGTPVQIEP